MTNNKNIITYTINEFDINSLRTSQSRILEVAENLVKEGKYDLGVVLYSKLLDKHNIKKVNKIKIEKNISDIMVSVKQTIKTAKKYIPSNAEIITDESDEFDEIDLSLTNENQQKITDNNKKEKSKNSTLAELLKYAVDKANTPEEQYEKSIPNTENNLDNKDINEKLLNKIDSLSTSTSKLINKTISKIKPEYKNTTTDNVDVDKQIKSLTNELSDKENQGAELSDFTSNIDESKLLLTNNFFNKINEIENKINNDTISYINNSLFPPKIATEKYSEVPKDNKYDVKLNKAFFSNINKLSDDANKIKDSVDQLKDSFISKISNHFFPPLSKDSIKKNISSKLEDVSIDKDYKEDKQLVNKKEYLAPYDPNEFEEKINNLINNLSDSNNKSNISETTNISENLNDKVNIIKDLVENLKDEKDTKEINEKKIDDFKETVDKLKSRSKDEDAPEEPVLEVFKANEEIIIKKHKEKIKPETYSDNYHKVLYFPDNEAYKKNDIDNLGFYSLNDILSEDYSNAEKLNDSGELIEKVKKVVSKNIDLQRTPYPHNVENDYKNKNGFLEHINKPLDTEKTINIDNDNLKNHEAPIDNEYNTNRYADKENKDRLNEPEKQTKPKPEYYNRSLKNPVILSYDFRSLFKTKFYLKYKDILNEAAMLVANKKLDEALEYYYVILDQNIPSALKLMIKQNIEDIEQTITNTFRYSDTIVKLKESGEVSRLKVVDEIEYGEDKVSSKEIVFTEE